MSVVWSHPVRGRHTHVTDIARHVVVDQTDVAKSLQRKARNWLVLWSPWRQKFTAFACFTSEPLIIDEADSDRFLARLQKIELTYRALLNTQAT